MNSVLQAINVSPTLLQASQSRTDSLPKTQPRVTLNQWQSHRSKHSATAGVNPLALLSAHHLLSPTLSKCLMESEPGWWSQKDHQAGGPRRTMPDRQSVPYRHWERVHLLAVLLQAVTNVSIVLWWHLFGDTCARIYSYIRWRKSFPRYCFVYNFYSLTLHSRKSLVAIPNES